MSNSIKLLWPLAVVLLLAILSYGKGDSSDNVLANHQLRALTHVSLSR